MNNNLFRNASIKLTAIYLLIIMTISITFSFWIYNVSISQIRQSIRRPPGPVEQILRRENTKFEKELNDANEQTINEARINLIIQLIVLNAIILISGSFASYYLGRRSLDPIEKSHEAQKKFVADASHELRTPITAMRIETEITLTDPNLSIKNAKMQLKSNIEELDKLTRLSEELLQLASLESETITKSAVILNDILDPAISRIGQKLKSKNQIVQVDNDYTGKIALHKNSMIEALVTILDNASKYSPKKSLIKISTRQVAHTIEISITDSGPGLNEKDIAHIFDRFYRADSSRNKNNTETGYGIGLSIAKVTVSAHHGAITASNNKINGATFTISLPVK